jgi:hypothetical protein
LCFTGQADGLAHVAFLIVMGIRAIVARHVDLVRRKEWMLPNLMTAGLAVDYPPGVSQIRTQGAQFARHGPSPPAGILARPPKKRQ